MLYSLAASLAEPQETRPRGVVRSRELTETLSAGTLSGPHPPPASSSPRAFSSGDGFYLLRRVSGTLIFAMLLHALWDFSSFAGNTGLTGGLGPTIGVASVMVAIVLTRKDSGAERGAAVN